MQTLSGSLASFFGTPSLGIAHPRRQMPVRFGHVVALLLIVMTTGCGTGRVVITESPKVSSVRVHEPVTSVLDEAPILLVPIDTSGSLVRPLSKAGQAKTSPDTVYVFRGAPRVTPELAFPLVQVSVDSSVVRIFGATTDCVFTAPAYGERLVVTTSAAGGCDGYVEGSPIGRKFTVPRELIQKDKGFFAQAKSLVSDIFIGIMVIAASLVVVALFRAFK